MAVEKLNKALNQELDILKEKGTAKGKELVITGVKPAEGKYGPRYYIEGEGKKRIYQDEFKFLSRDVPS